MKKSTRNIVIVAIILIVFLLLLILWNHRPDTESNPRNDLNKPAAVMKSEFKALSAC